ncbi:MAG: 2-C-methyl-D-erythritol 4-phosphate cytidylyltransferase [Bacteroidales bacterium]|nr:2-C-methyl-D-erythritol 4-phosphate cytidylyltransferase [Bacteroidales bacterium]
MAVEKYIIFACGGRGTRMGAEVPKQFLRLEGKTILQLSIERVLEAVPDVQVVLALPSQYREFWAEECERQSFDIRQRIVDGGITRFHSVKNALEKVPDNALVAVHDAVRPFAGIELIRTLFSLAELHPAVIPVIPVTDTLKVLKANEAGELEEVPGSKADRSVLFGAQTPQLFRADVLKKAYEQPYDTAFTDDASVVQAMGCAIKYIPGERYNIKLTTPEDMDFAQKLLR